MYEAIGQSLIFAVGMAIFPVPIIAMVLLLLTPKAKANSLSYLAGWVAGIFIVGALALLLITPYESYITEQSDTAVNWLKLGLALVLIYFGVQKMLKQFSAKNVPQTPSWMAAISDFSPKKSAGTGFALSGLNPKNILLIIGGATAIVEAELSYAQQFTSLIVFTLVASLGVGIPVIIYFVLGDKSAKILGSIKVFMEANSSGIMAAIFLLIGVMMLGDAISGR